MSPITSPHISKGSTQYPSKYPCAVRNPVTIVTIGPSITANGRISALPCAIRNVSRVTKRSQTLVVDVGAVGSRQTETSPGIEPIVPQIDPERAAQVVMVGRDGTAGCYLDLVGALLHDLGTQQDAILQ